MISYEEGSILVRLILAHVLTDFFLQPDSWVADKRQKGWSSVYLYLHSLLAGLLSWVFLWDLNLWLPVLIITITHFLIDGFKLSADARLLAKRDGSDPAEAEIVSQKRFRHFLIDQIAHVVILLAVWCWIIDGAGRFQLSRILLDYRLLLYTAGYLLVLRPAGFLIHLFTSRWSASLDLNDSLKDVGKWIGMMERTLILTLVLLDQYSAIGFLVTAKSLLRLIDKPEVPGSLMPPRFSARKHTEYVLVGTFLSISIALGTGIIVRLLL